MNINYRQQALEGLTPLLQGNPLPDAFAHYLPSAKYLLLQTCRYFYRLERIALQFVTKTPKDKTVFAILILGLAELHQLDKQAHAVINEFVSLCKKNKFSSASGLVNAVLRKSITHKAAWENTLASDLSYLYAHPLWFIKRVQEDYPHHWQDILAANNAHPPMTLRVNQAKIKRDAYLKAHPLNATMCSHSQNGFTLHDAIDIKDIPGFNEGLISVQDEAAQLCPSLLLLQDELRVLDACAAPGGKTAHMLETNQTLKLVALELQAFRFERLKSTLQRLDLAAELIQGNALNLDTWWHGQYFDRILIDAPCSGTGVIRRHPDIKLRRQEQSIALNLEIQQALLQKLWQTLKPGGRMLYATCSILKEENDRQIQTFLENTNDALHVEIINNVGLKTRYGLQILPGQNNMDGFYYAMLAKKADNGA
ncbi:MAG: 16S rRNA (cytosine(967)-C(5))-methyltransferase RsmB [Gammaproteobacteria bacterium]|nr:16S rRNA (cytosine(967)-C(5))-methyltransferase RsmB [Gammaproteobacteria bacterium]